MTRAQRRDALLSAYCFVCGCDACAQEEAADAEREESAETCLTGVRCRRPGCRGGVVHPMGGVPAGPLAGPYALPAGTGACSRCRGRMSDAHLERVTLVAVEATAAEDAALRIVEGAACAGEWKDGAADRAGREYSEALRLRREFLPDLHLLVLSATRGAARAAAAAGHVRRAGMLFADAHDLIVRRYGADSVQTAMSALEIGAVVGRRGLCIQAAASGGGEASSAPADPGYAPYATLRRHWGTRCADECVRGMEAWVVGDWVRGSGGDVPGWARRR